MTKILVEDIERFIPITSVWETVGGCEEIATVNFLRGCFLTSFGMIETNLKNIAIHCSKIDNYQSIVGDPPTKKKSLIKFLRKALEIEGPLIETEDDCGLLLNFFDDGDSLRNQWAHGHLRCLPGDKSQRMKGAWITLETINGLDKYQMQTLTSRWTIDQIQEHVVEAKNMAELSARLYNQLQYPD